MDRAFVHPLRLSNGETVVTITSAQEAGAFLLQHWPTKRRRRMAYVEAVRACVRTIGGKVEPEVARQALIEALTDSSLRQYSGAPGWLPVSPIDCIGAASFHNLARRRYG